MLSIKLLIIDGLQHLAHSKVIRGYQATLEPDWIESEVAKDGCEYVFIMHNILSPSYRYRRMCKVEHKSLMNLNRVGDIGELWCQSSEIKLSWFQILLLMIKACMYM